MVGSRDRKPDDRLAGFEFEAGDDRWMDLIRKAEQPLVMGRSGRYELLSEVSRGGQGIVYRARDIRNGRIVAVKRLIAGSLASLPSRMRFKREVETAASLDHPNIVRVFGLNGGDGSQPLLVMQWIDGVPITDWAAPPDGERRSLREIVELFVKVCGAVHHAHLRGVIHRDLKPSNVLVDAGGEPHLLDFGLAKLNTGHGGESGVTLSGQFLGTPAFASPEHVRGGPTAVDVRSDVYSLGVVLYQVLSGCMPYPVDGSLADVFQSIMHAEPRPPSSVAAIDRDLQAVLLKTLAKHPRDRYQSANALGTDLGRYLRGEALEARADGRLYVLGKTVRRHRVMVTVTAACLAVLVGFTATMSVMYRRAERQAEHARQSQLFLQEMLASASPYRSGGSVDLADMLRRAAARIETDLAGQPEAQAGVHHTIARIYAGLWMWKDSEPHLRIALLQYRGLYGGDHAEIAACLTLLGRGLSFMRRPDAEYVQRRALAMRRRLYGDVHPLIAETTGNLAFAIWKTADPPRLDEAERTYRLALDLYDRVLDGPTDDWARITYSFGEFQHDRGRVDESLSLFKTSLDMYRATSGSGDVYMTQVLEAYAWTLKEKGRYAEALAALEESIPLRPEGFADERIVGLRWRLGVLHHLLDDPARALDEFDESLALRCELRGRGTAGGTASLAGRALRLRDHEHAAAYYGEVLDALSVWEPLRAILGCMLDVTDCIQAMRGPEAADPLVQRAVALTNPENGRRANSTELARARTVLGRRLVDLERFETAEVQLRSSYRVLRFQRGEQCPYTRAAMRGMVRLYRAWGKPQEAAVYAARLAESV